MSQEKMNAKKGGIEIQLLGQKIGLRATESDPELLKEIVELVQTKLKSAEKRARGAVSHQVVLLALMEMAEEYIKAKHRTIVFKREVGEKSDHLLHLLEDESDSRVSS